MEEKENEGDNLNQMSINRKKKGKNDCSKIKSTLNAYFP
jgi:hypothetical protein